MMNMVLNTLPLNVFAAQPKAPQLGSSGQFQKFAYCSMPDLTDSSIMQYTGT